jgi:hypothetical protein
METEYQLAQLNVARARFDRTDPRFQSFVDLVQPVNALADRMPGFVWRLADETGVGSTDIKAFDDPNMLVNMSVWEDFQSLEDFAFNTVHAKVMNRKAEWFGLMESQHLVLWWVASGHRPDLAEARSRLTHLDQNGPSPTAFTFKQRYNSDGSPIPSPGP